MIWRFSFNVNVILWVIVSVIVNRLTGTYWCSVPYCMFFGLIMSRNAAWFGRDFVRKWYFRMYYRKNLEYNIASFTGGAAYILLLKLSFCDERQYIYAGKDVNFTNWLFDVHSKHADYRSEEEIADDEETRRLREESQEMDPTDWGNVIHNGKVVGIDSIPESDIGGDGNKGV